jgi:hypothetical protein
MATQEVRSMVSSTSICNQAMSWLAVDPIISLEDDSNTAQWCRLNYPFLRDAVLEERMWTFATDRAVSTVADKDAWGDMYVHPLPISWQAVYRCYRTVNKAGSLGHAANITSEGWVVEGGNVLSYDSTIYLWGTIRITDTGAFSSLFVQALAARIAADACMPFTENQKLQRDMWDLFNGKLREAAARDGQQGSNDVIQSNTLIDARAGSGYGV